MDNNKKEFIEAVNRLRCELKCPKDQKNGFAKFSYRSLPSILENVNPLCKKNGLLLEIIDEIMLEGLVIKTVVTLSDCYGNKVSSSGLALIELEKSTKGMGKSQSTGSALTYSRKYALEALFCISDGVDSDSLTQGPNEKRNYSSSSKGTLATENQKKYILKLLPGTKLDPDLTAKQASEIIAKKVEKGVPVVANG